MKILDIFKKGNTTPTRFLQANATSYPDKILIETTDRVRDGFGISSVKITILAADPDSELLGSTVRHHLKLSEDNLRTPKDLNKNYNEFLSVAGFRNGKEHHKDALQLLIDQVDNVITLYPNRNGGWTGKNRGFTPVENAEIKVDANSSNSDLGESIKLGWTKCE